MAILNNSNAISSGGYDINNSLRLRASASAYLNRTPASNGNQQIFTWSGWVKRGQLSSEQAIIVCRTGSNAAFGRLVFTSGDALQFFARNSSSTTTALLNTTSVYRDPSAWYHIVLAVDTTQATAANRIKFYVNGTQVTAFSTATYPTQNTNLDFNTTADTYIGVEIPNAIYFDGYMAEVNFVNAQQLTPSSFGETDTDTGSWKPKAYTGTYGTNGFYLKFSDIATTSGSNAGLGKDFSGNTNYWTTNNISVTAGVTYDAMIDSPTLTSATVANYAVMNPNLRQTGTGQAPTSANLKLTANTSGYSQVCCATIASTSGKFYWEVTVNGGVGTIGIADSNNSLFTSVVCSTSATTSDPNEYTWGWSVNLGSGNKKNNNTSTSYGSAASSGDVYMLAVDIDNGKVWWGKNGTWFASGSPAAGTNAAFTNVSGNIIPYVSLTDGSGYTNDINFGQRPFSYTPPTGFVRLNTYNLPDSTIKKGNTVMDATLYTGNGSTQTITNAGAFKPDLVWLKNRGAVGDHGLYDSVRGVTQRLRSNTTSAEDTISGVTAFNTNGFSLGADYNGSSATFVGWQWQANQGSTVSNTSGTITSTVSVNTTAGFSVVTYTGTGANATVGHGLGVAPRMMLFKNRTSAVEWQVYHASIGNGQYGVLNSTAAFATSGIWQNTTPTSSVFSIASGFSGVNTNASTYVAYCWAEIAGFSRFGSYTGNGSTDGVFVYLGFRPEFLMIKVTNAVNEWIVVDSARATSNVIGNYLLASTSAAEDSGYTLVDFVSNGFKMRNSFGGWNGSGENIIYMAFAENPFKNALAR